MMKKVVIIILLVGVISLGAIFALIDINRVSEGKSPIFVIQSGHLRDGGSVEFIGLGYKVIKYHKICLNEDEENNWFYQGYDIKPWFINFKEVDCEVERENNNN